MQQATKYQRVILKKKSDFGDFTSSLNALFAFKTGIAQYKYKW